MIWNMMCLTSNTRSTTGWEILLLKVDLKLNRREEVEARSHPGLGNPIVALSNLIQLKLFEQETKIAEVEGKVTFMLEKQKA